VRGVTVYRVTWKSFEPAGAEHVRDFADVDQGYTFYQMMKRDGNSWGATWAHISEQAAAEAPSAQPD